MQAMKIALLSLAVALVLVLATIDSVQSIEYDDDDGADETMDARDCITIQYKSGLKQIKAQVYNTRAKECKACCKQAGKNLAYFGDEGKCKCSNNYAKTVYKNFL